MVENYIHCKDNFNGGKLHKFLKPVPPLFARAEFLWAGVSIQILILKNAASVVLM